MSNSATIMLSKNNITHFIILYYSQADKLPKPVHSLLNFAFLPAYPDWTSSIFRQKLKINYYLYQWLIKIHQANLLSWQIPYLTFYSLCGLYKKLLWLTINSNSLKLLFFHPSFIVLCICQKVQLRPGY